MKQFPEKVGLGECSCQALGSWSGGPTLLTKDRVLSSTFILIDHYTAISSILIKNNFYNPPEDCKIINYNLINCKISTNFVFILIDDISRKCLWRITIIVFYNFSDQQSYAPLARDHALVWILSSAFPILRSHRAQPELH